MTFNQIAEIFAKRWSKDVNRTHVASIMRLREKNFADSTPKKVKTVSLMPSHSSPGAMERAANMIPFGSGVKIYKTILCMGINRVLIII